jgi:hypothetical protein
MKSFALKIIRNNYVELARSEAIKKLPKDLLLDILVDMSQLFDNTKADCFCDLTALRSQVDQSTGISHKPEQFELNSSK